MFSRVWFSASSGRWFPASVCSSSLPVVWRGTLRQRVLASGDDVECGVGVLCVGSVCCGKCLCMWTMYSCHQQQETALSCTAAAFSAQAAAPSTTNSGLHQLLVLLLLWQLEYVV